jgi:hypothetical protein
MFNHVSWNAWNPTSYGIDTNPQSNASISKPWKKPTKTQKHKKTKNENKKRNPESHLTSHTLLFSLLFTLLLFALCVDFFSKSKCLLYLATYRYKRFPQVFFPLFKQFPLSLALQPFPPRRLPSRPFPSRAIQAALPEESAKRKKQNKVLVSIRLLVRRSFAAGGIRTANLLGDTQTPSHQANHPAKQSKPCLKPETIPPNNPTLFVVGMFKIIVPMSEHLILFTIGLFI